MSDERLAEALRLLERCRVLLPFTEQARLLGEELSAFLSEPAPPVLTKAERHVLAHSLGHPKRGRDPYRNHFCASEGHDDWNTLQGLVARGLMVSRKPSALSGGDVIFIVTDEGIAALRAGQ